MAIDYHTILLSPATNDEMGRVFERVKFDRYVPSSVRRRLAGLIRDIAERVEVDVTFNLCRDPKDNMILELAVELALHAPSGGLRFPHFQKCETITT